MGQSIPQSTQHPDSFGTRLIQSTFFLFALVVPVCHLIALKILWLLPLSARRQKQLYTLCEILNAWSALDVFVVSLLAALLEINQFAAFMVGDKVQYEPLVLTRPQCDLISYILVHYFGGLADGKCFEVIPTLDTGCWLLFGACVLYIGAGNVVMRICHQVIARISEEAQDKLTHSVTEASALSSSGFGTDGGRDSLRKEISSESEPM